MTSPDRLPLSSYQAGTKPVGEWDMGVNLAGLGAALITIPMQLLSAALQGIFGGGSGSLADGVLSTLSDLMSLRWAQADRHETEISNLQDATTNLSLASGHATAYMASSPGTTTSPTRMPFTTAITAPRDVTNLGDGRWRLDSAGEWDLSAQVEFWGGDLMPADTYLEIVVRYPSWWPAAPAKSGTVYDGVRAIAQSNRNITLTNVTSTQVPEPGFTVEVQAWTGAFPLIGGSFRGIRGGYSTTRLRIRKFEMLREAS